MTKIVLATLPEELSIHRMSKSAELAQVLADRALADINARQTLFASLHSQDELSIVCAATLSVNSESTSGPWRAIHVIGPLDFALTGVLSGLAAPLAAAQISIFAISSFDTDYLLVKAETLEVAISTLERAAYSFRHTD